MKFTWRHILWGAASVIAALVVVAVLVAAFVSVQILGQVRNTQLDGTPTGKKLVAGSNQIQSCTTPGQPCFQDAQRRQAALVAGVNKSSRANAAAAAACAARPGVRGFAMILRCMDAALAPSRR